MHLRRAVLKPDAQAKEELGRSFACASGFNPAMNNTDKPGWWRL
jgi:hypothetical protein